MAAIWNEQHNLSLHEAEVAKSRPLTHAIFDDQQWADLFLIFYTTFAEVILFQEVTILKTA